MRLGGGSVLIATLDSAQSSKVRLSWLRLRLRLKLKLRFRLKLRIGLGEGSLAYN